MGQLAYHIFKHNAAVSDLSEKFQKQQQRDRGDDEVRAFRKLLIRTVRILVRVAGEKGGLELSKIEGLRIRCEKVEAEGFEEKEGEGREMSVNDC